MQIAKQSCVHSRGAAAIEIAIVCALVMMVCMAAVGRIGYNSAKKFCRPIQAVSFDNIEAVGQDEDVDSFHCEDEFGADIPGYPLNRAF